VSHYPISTYLVSVAVGEYVEYLGTYNRLPDLAAQYGALSMPLRHLVYDDGSSGLWSNWAMVGDMIDAFEHWFGPYPFADEKYGHAECTFGGGMEHQTMTSMGASSSISLASHELAHQWYGDGISPKTWPHLWLNEGFATYAELVYWEARSASYPGYFESYRSSRYTSAKSASGTLVVEDTTSVNNLFAYSRVYAKGATVLHMLRTVVGDATFKDILREYAMDPAVRYGVAKTDDFKSVAETESGMDLDQFFSQWVTEGTGYPTYRMSANWYSAPGGGYTVYVAVEQTQTMPQSNMEVFEMPLTIAVQTLSGEERFVVQNDKRNQMFELSVVAEPTSVAVDPDEVVLRSSTIATGIGNTPQASMLTIQSITPNPARNSLSLQFGTGDASEIAIDVYDVAGRRVLSRSVGTVAAGVQFQTLDTSALATGVYFLRIRGYKGQATRKFVVVR
jgi:aminopeptidase N